MCPTARRGETSISNVCRSICREGVVRPVRMLLLLGVAVLLFGVAACGDDNGDKAARTVTETVTDAADTVGEYLPSSAAFPR